MITTPKTVIPEELEKQINRYFPKGKCKERGNALVLFVAFLLWHEKEVKAAREEGIREAQEEIASVMKTFK